MLVLALLLSQALGLPEVEDPMPDKIGLNFLVSLAGVGGMFGGFLSLVWPRRREWFISLGTLAGFCIGLAIYVSALIGQLVSRL
jgi:hypothetical protein